MEKGEVGKRMVTGGTYFCGTFDILGVGGDEAGLVLVGSGHVLVRRMGW